MLMTIHRLYSHGGNIPKGMSTKGRAIRGAPSVSCPWCEYTNIFWAYLLTSYRSKTIIKIGHFTSVVPKNISFHLKTQKFTIISIFYEV